MRARVTLPPLHSGQQSVWDSPARFKVLVCGRRWGKTMLGALACMVTAMRGGRAWWVAPTYPIAGVGWNMMRRLQAQLPFTSKNEVDRRIDVEGGGWAQVRSADNPDSLRGEGLDLVVLDECAYIKEAAWFEALRPALSDRQGKAIFISTPAGRNWFWQLYLRGESGEDGWQSWRFPTASNPFIAQPEVDEAERTLPERVFHQEFLAEFLEDAGSVFRRVMDAATATPAPSGIGTFIGVDWGKHLDFTVLTVLDKTGAMVAMDRFNQIDYAVQAGRLAAMAKRYNPQAILAELNAMGEPIVEQLQRQGLPVVGFQTTNASKTGIIESLALAFEKGDIRILPDQVLVNELQAYEMTRLPSGATRYSAPDGLHDDCVMSLALAWRARQELSAPSISVEDY